MAEQPSPVTCELASTSSVDLSQRGGYIIPSSGILKVLVVFVSFKDDTTAHPYWPVGQPPSILNTYIDSTSTQNSINLVNLTHYFDKMSLGVFDVIGKAIWVETPDSMHNYGTPRPSRSQAVKDVLENKVDSLVNFSEFDNWTYDSSYTQTNSPDGMVDMIVMIWRGLVFSTGWQGEASLGHGQDLLVEDSSVVIGRMYGFDGSGLTVQDWGARSSKNNFHTAVHEFGHWLLGENHPYSGGIFYDEDEHAFWGILRHSSDGICANTYERERLADLAPEK